MRGEHHFWFSTPNGPVAVVLTGKDEAIQDVVKYLVESGLEVRDEGETFWLPNKPQGHYKEWCRDPSLCDGKGYCPRNPSCAD